MLPTYRRSVLPPPYSLSSPAVQPLISKSWRRRQPAPPKRQYLSICMLWHHKTLKSSRFLLLPHQANWEYERILYVSLFRFHVRRITYQTKCVLSYRALTVLFLCHGVISLAVSQLETKTLYAMSLSWITLPNEVFVLERSYTTLFDTLCIQLQAAYFLEGANKCRLHLPA